MSAKICEGCESVTSGARLRCREQIEIAAEHEIKSSAAPAAVRIAHQRRRLSAVSTHNRVRPRRLLKCLDDSAPHLGMREILQRCHYQPHARRCAISTALGLGNLQDVKPAFVSERAVSAKTGNDLDGRLPLLLARDFLDLHVPVLRPGAMHVAQLPTPRSNVIACFCS